MRLKMLMVGQSGTGKTHLCVNIGKAVKTVILDVDEKADVIVSKLDAEDTVTVMSGTPFTTFMDSLKKAINSDAELIVVDSLTELKDIIKRWLKNKILARGEFYIGGVERKETTKIDPDTFLITWELHPVIYDRIRDIMKAINSAGKSFIFTYHPPTEAASKGEIKMLQELKRICNMTVFVDKDTVNIKTDLFCDNTGNMTANSFIEYVRKIITANSVKEVM